MDACALLLLFALAGAAAGFSGAPFRNAPPAASESAPPPSTDLSDAEVAARVRTYLAAIDTPIGAEKWRTLGPRAASPLEAVVNDPSELPSRRAKAVFALALVGGARAETLVREVARSESEPLAVRASALEGAGLLLGPGELVKALRPILERSREATVRALAAGVLSRRAKTRACGAIRAQAKREPEDERALFEAALARCAPSP
ncbi:MAG TPA: hypothetical protein VLV17_06735 [Anaeromyxobacteraceae bacterium]|nr:hypothetical protein [Anaeromyxobacteraceae bacterium]